MPCELRIYLYVKVASRISFEQHFKNFEITTSLACNGFQQRNYRVISFKSLVIMSKTLRRERGRI